MAETTTPLYRHAHITACALVTLVLMVALMSFSGCKKRVSPTTLSVIDSVRHYYPIVAGEKLNVVYTIVNHGDDPFLIDDVQPSCGCIAGKVEEVAIPPHDSLTLSFVFDSSKNVGYVRHCIRIFGNVLPRGMATLVFDVNVVPPSDAIPDYEETYQRETDACVKDLVDGTPAQKGYYTDDEGAKDSRRHVRYPWRE